MPNLMQTGATWLGERLQTHATRTVSVTQGLTEITDLTAWHAKYEHEVTDSEGFATKVSSEDWNFVAADLPAGFEFRNGAIITETISGVENKYEAMPMGRKPCFERMDTSGILLTVHTKRTA